MCSLVTIDKDCANRYELATHACLFPKIDNCFQLNFDAVSSVKGQAENRNTYCYNFLIRKSKSILCSIGTADFSTVFVDVS